ncbi:MAG: cytochrome c oxidase subunit 3 [Alphaproteobacteria bacterium]|nr:cytochrome c oxidase subunit 3 [Alphaproteobacteria bacterium]
MADGAVNHDYHLVKPSPWPILGAIGILLMVLGGAAYMKGLFGIPEGTWWAPLPGFLWIVWVLVGWWGDVIKESRAGDHKEVVQISLRYGMVLFIASEVMFFVAWFWGFFEGTIFHDLRASAHYDLANPDLEALRGWSEWPVTQVTPEGPERIHTFNPFHLPLINTLILLLSGTTVTWAHHALQVNDRNGAKIGLLLTVLLGAAFTAFQVIEYGEAGFSYDGSLYGSAFFMATGFHGAHVVIGTIFLLVCLLRLMAGGMKPAKHLGFEFAAWYWHFVDVVWLFLFAFVYVAPDLVWPGGAAVH